jgi:F-type H+-transporting ATPase subunit epsilon
MPDLQLVLVTPEKTLLDEPVATLRFPLFDGQIGILPGRAPMVGRLGYGELRIRTGSGEQSFYIDGGFVQVKGPTVSLLTNRAIPAGRIDADEARRLLDDAAKKPAGTDAEYAIREREFERGRRLLAMS